VSDSPRVTGWRRWTTGPRGWALASAVLAGLVFGAGWWEVGRWREAQRLRGEVHLRLSERAQALAAAVARRVTLLDGFHAFVELQVGPHRLESTFADYAARLQRAVPGVRNLGVARGSTYVLVSPVEGNERILGYNPLLDERPDVRRAAQDALDGDGAVVSGPLELVQGGTGLIARRAVRVDGRVWGFVAVVADIGPILEEAGFTRAGVDLLLAVRSKGKTAFFGRDETFSGDPVIRDVEVPGGRWEIAGKPAPAWSRRLAEGRRLWTASGLVLGLIPMTLVFALTWRQRVRTAYHQETERLVEERTAALARTSVIV
jgi:sensor domain CHASE-containing protein